MSGAKDSKAAAVDTSARDGKLSLAYGNGSCSAANSRDAAPYGANIGAIPAAKVAWSSQGVSNLRSELVATSMPY